MPYWNNSMKILIGKDNVILLWEHIIQKNAALYHSSEGGQPILVWVEWWEIQKAVPKGLFSYSLRASKHLYLKCLWSLVSH